MLKKREIYILTFGITALYLIYTVIPNFSILSIFITGFNGYRTTSGPTIQFDNTLLITLFRSVILFFCSILLWLNAGRIADSILNRTDETSPNEKWTLKEILTLSVIITGILLLFSTVQRFPWHSLLLLFLGSYMSNFDSQNLTNVSLDLMVSVIKILFSLYFISRPKRIVSMLTDRIQDQSMAD